MLTIKKEKNLYHDKKKLSALSSLEVFQKFFFWRFSLTVLSEEHTSTEPAPKAPLVRRGQWVSSGRRDDGHVRTAGSRHWALRRSGGRWAAAFLLSRLLARLSFNADTSRRGGGFPFSLLRFWTCIMKLLLFWYCYLNIYFYLKLGMSTRQLPQEL